MGMHWIVKSLSEERVLEALKTSFREAQIRRRDMLRQELIALLLRRASLLTAFMLLITIPAWPESCPPPDWLVCFTPGYQCTDTLVHALRQAKHTILVQAYSFTSAPIATALRDAHRRGVQVQVILDKSQRAEKYSSADFLVNQGVSVMIDASHAIAHNKVIIVDGDTLITGSFNFTRAAQERNAENLLIIRDAALATDYTHNWEQHRQHSQPYSRRR